MNAVILRLGHRLPRDERITTHVALISRAFGVEKMFYSGMKDSSLESSISELCERWGGSFSVIFSPNPLKVIKNHKKEGYAVVHLTMYGLPFVNFTEELKTKEKLLIVVGGEKVPREIYELADYNLSIGTQPHSEVAALAIALDRLTNGRIFHLSFEGKIKIIPDAKEKKIVRN